MNHKPFLLSCPPGPLTVSITKYDSATPSGGYGGNYGVRISISGGRVPYTVSVKLYKEDHVTGSLSLDKSYSDTLTTTPIVNKDYGLRISGYYYPNKAIVSITSADGQREPLHGRGS